MMCMLFCAASYQNASVHTCTLISCSVSHHPDGVTGNRRVQGRIQDKKRGGGTIHCFFRTAASLESRASPKKADERGGGGGGGGTPTLCFSERHQRRESRKSQMGGGGGNPTHFCFRFQKGGGGNFLQKGFKRGGGHGPGVPPPPKSATDRVYDPKYYKTYEWFSSLSVWAHIIWYHVFIFLYVDSFVITVMHTMYIDCPIIYWSSL